MSEEKQRQGASSNERREERTEERREECSNVRIGLRVLAAAGAISSGAIIILDSVRQFRECNLRDGCDFTPAGSAICP